MTKLDDFFKELDMEGYQGEAWSLSREELDDRRRRLVEVLGFTREHVRATREAAAHHAGAGTEEHLVVGLQLHSLADLIEALLPPEEK